MIKAIINYLLILTLATYPTTSWSIEPVPENLPTAQESRAAIEEIMSLVNRSQFDLDSLLDHLDYDLEEIVSFVTGGIRFQQYPGLLRGPVATLAGRSGNALDQATLLAKLLKDSGYDARIARSEISSRDALRLLKTMELNHGNALPPIGDIEKIKELLSRPGYAESGFFQAIGLLLDNLSGPPKKGVSPVVDGVADAEIVLSKLREPLDSLVMPDRNITEQLVTETRDYYWVETRSGPSDEWQRVHPVLPEGFKLSDPHEVTEYFANKVPQSLSHHVSVQVFIERNWGGKIESIPVTGKWQAPSANLSDFVISYTNSPSGLADEAVETREQIKDGITRSNFFLPTLNDALAPKASGFDVAGNVFSTDMIDFSKMGVFQTINTKGSAAGAAISSLGESKETTPEEFQSLTRQWIELQVIAPDGTTRTIHRDIYNAATHDSPEKRAIALTRTMTLTVPVGEPSRAQVFYTLLDSFLMLNKAFAQSDCSKPSGTCSGVTMDINSQTLLISRMFDHISIQAAMSLGSTGLIYRAEPGLTARYMHHYLPLLEHHAADIVHNKRRSIGFEGNQVVSRHLKTLKFGVAESVLEKRLVGLGSETTAASLLINSQNEVWNIIQDTGGLDKLKLGDVEKEFMEKDLLAGYSLILDQNNINTQGPNSWWRIDPKTGEILGMLSNGTGGALGGFFSLGQPVSESLITRRTGYTLVEIIKIKGAKTMACILAGVTITVLLGVAISSLVSPTGYTLPIIAAFTAIGAAELIPSVSAMAAQWAQAGKNWVQLIRYLVELCILKI